VFIPPIANCLPVARNSRIEHDRKYDPRHDLSALG